MVECLTRDREAAGSSLTGITALWSLSKTIYPSLVLVQPRKTRSCLTERLLMGRKESNKHLLFFQVLLEAQEVAVRDHNVEFKSNLWVADAYCTKGMTLKGQKLHSRGRMGTLHFNFCHLFIRLREGTPPEHYYPPEPSGNQKMEEYIKEQRSRKILESL